MNMTMNVGDTLPHFSGMNRAMSQPTLLVAKHSVNFGEDFSLLKGRAKVVVVSFDENLASLETPEEFEVFVIKRRITHEVNDIIFRDRLFPRRNDSLGVVIRVLQLAETRSEVLDIFMTQMRIAQKED
jgi:hypothetical protein